MLSKKDLLYRPNLEYDKNYYTEGKIEKDRNEHIEVSQVTNTKEDTIKLIINDIDNKFNFIPEDIINTYFPPFFGMKDEFDRIDKEYNTSEDKEETSKPETSKPDNPGWEIVDPDKGEEDFPSLFDRADDVYIDITDPFSDPAKVIKESYYIDFVDIYEDYLNKVSVSLSNYVMTTYSSLMTQGLNDDIINYASKDIKNKKLLHLSDYITKSSISIDQMMRLHTKLFQIDEIIFHIRSIRISNDQRIRYNEIEELNQFNSLDQTSNIILKESRRVSEKKYEESLYGLYKYLNSSVILLDESLKTITKQNKAILIINEKEER